MTEKQIRDFALAYRLKVEKRITTGNERAHFATFELTVAVPERDGPLSCETAAMFRAHAITRGSHRDLCGERRSDINGERYLFIESVWCEPFAEPRVYNVAPDGADH